MPQRDAADRINTKVIATLGPASSDPQRLAAMLDAGLDVCRLNFSHGELEQHRRTLQTVRTLAAERRQGTTGLAPPLRLVADQRTNTLIVSASTAPYAHQPDPRPQTAGVCVPRFMPQLHPW